MDCWKRLEDRQETFLIRMGRAQDGKWQGNVVWIGGKCEQSFTSMQELVSLIDNAMEDEQPEMAED